MAFSSTLDRNIQEVPVTATPIFEGYLSVKRDKKYWQWRLFRFDGSNFTCLSSRKVKLNNETITNSNLLATPKDKNNRLIQADENKIELKYYQSPEWMIDVVDISAISVLKKKKSSTPSKCFSIRTFSGQCFILKAQKQKDLERWLFVLTKMWKFTQAVHNSQQYYFNTQQQAQAQQQQQINNEEDNIPLVHSIQPQQQQPKEQSILLSDEKIRVIEEWRKSLAELMANDPNIRRISTTPPPIEPIPDDDTMSVFTDMTSVSNRQPRTASSLRKRSAGSTITKRNKINSISPGGNTETALLERQVPTLRKKRSDDVRNWMNNGVNRKPSLISRPTPISTSTPTNNQYYQQQQSTTTTSSEIYSNNMNFFQDIMSNINYATQKDNDDTTNNQDNVCLKYHTPIKGKKLIIQGQQGEKSDKITTTTTLLTKEQEKENRRQVVIEEGEGEAERQQVTALSKEKEEEEEGAQINNNDGSNQDNYYSTKRTIIRRASMPLTDNNLLLQQQFLLDQQQQQQQQQKLLQQSPLEQLFYNNNEEEEEEEEDMSLADLQKSLRKVTLNRHKRSPSASSIHDLQKQQRQSIQAYYYQQHLTQLQAIVAPAIPPLQIQQQQQQPYLFDPSSMAAAAYYHYHDQQQLRQLQQQQQFAISFDNSANSKRASSLMNHYNTISNNSNIYNR